MCIYVYVCVCILLFLITCSFLPFIFKKCVAYTGNNMRKQTPIPDKKEKDVR